MFCEGKKGNDAARNKMKQAIRVSKLIAKFPFVESISISGSLSKNYMEADSDIDFFIITKPKRLWLCRGLLVVFKKLFLFNSRKHFCINYYVDSNNLLIADQNIFTATEIVHLIPTYNGDLFLEFLKQNAWSKIYYPNKNAPKLFGIPRVKSSVRVFLEWMINGTVGEWLDGFFFRITLNRWKKKFGHFNEDEFDLNLRSRKNISKHHPRGYQKVVLDAYFKLTEAYQLQYNVKLL